MVSRQSWIKQGVGSYRWYPVVQGLETLCFEHPASQEELKDRVSETLAIADGVAFDGVGFRNRYACFCDRCEGIREEMMEENPALHKADVMAQVSEESLVKVSQILYAHAKLVKPEAIVMNHLWPPFRPNPYYGNRLKLDYCSQTISWFYKPTWSLDRVEFEAAEMKRLEDRSANVFVPFIGVYDDPYLVRSAERIAKELEIAGKYADGHVVFCNLKTLKRYPKIREVVKAALAD